MLLRRNLIVFIFIRLGGTCVNVGCVPKKLFCYASHFRELFHDAQAYGWPKIDMDLNDHNWKKLLENKNAEIQRLNDIYEKNQKDNKVNIIKGYATLKDQHTVVVDEKEYTAKYILLAVGGLIKQDLKRRNNSLDFIQVTRSFPISLDVNISLLLTRHFSWKNYRRKWLS